MADIANPYIDIRFQANTKTKTIEPLYQYDHGLRFRIYGLDLTKAMIIHYSYEG